MTDEERRIITAFVERVAGVQQAAPRAASPWGSVPNTAPAQQPLPPVDREADALLFELFNRYPEARYRLTQTAFVTEAALVEAQNRIQDLEWQLEGMQQQAQAPQRGGMFGMFGGGNRQQPMMPPRPQPMMPPGGNPGMFQQQRGGSGFLGTALMTAAGVAGGLVLGNALMGMMGGHGGAAQAATGGGFGQDAVPTSSPWTDPGGQADTAGYQGNDASGGYDQGSSDQGGGYDDAAGGYDDGGFDDNV